jgi:hypothetical protein
MQGCADLMMRTFFGTPASSIRASTKGPPVRCILVWHSEASGSTRLITTGGNTSPPTRRGACRGGSAKMDDARACDPTGSAGVTEGGRCFGGCSHDASARIMRTTVARIIPDGLTVPRFSRAARTHNGSALARTPAAGAAAASARRRSPEPQQARGASPATELGLSSAFQRDSLREVTRHGPSGRQPNRCGGWPRTIDPIVGQSGFSRGNSRTTLPELLHHRRWRDPAILSSFGRARGCRGLPHQRGAPSG